MSALSCPILLFLFLCSSLVWSQEELCKKPALNEKKLSEIVEKSRLSYPEIPKKIQTTSDVASKIKITRIRCHYHYLEDNPGAPLMIFIINQNGVLVDYQSGVFTSRKKCFFNPKVLSQEDLDKKLVLARTLDKSLPAAPKERRIEISRWGCGYMYAERVNATKGDVFIMDAFGDIYDFWTEK